MSTFELEGEFTVAQVVEVRRFVEKFLRAIGDRDLLGRLSMATHELFENAVKFSDDRVVTFRFEFAEHQFRITTKNRAKVEDLRALHKIAGRLRESTDMLAFYLDLMKNPRAARGGLGIGRVAAEAEMTVNMELVDDTVTIRAELQDAAAAA